VHRCVHPEHLSRPAANRWHRSGKVSTTAVGHKRSVGHRWVLVDASAMSMDDSSYDPMEKKRLMMQESQALNNSRYGGGSTLTGGAGNGRPEYSTNYDDSDLSGNTDYRPQNVDNEIALMRTRAGSQTRFLDDNDQFDRYPNDLDTNGEAPIRMEELPKRPPLSYAQRYKNGNRQASSSSTTSSYNRQRDPFM
jgi:hypothetical protein